MPRINGKQYGIGGVDTIDAAAFWGSHIYCGEISLYNASPVTEAEHIYPALVSKYQTANKLYLYIQAERGRSYNFYGDYPLDSVSFELQGVSFNYMPYATENVWPILIKSLTQTTITGVVIGIENVDNPNLINVDKIRASYIRASNLEGDSLKNYRAQLNFTGFNYEIKTANNGTVYRKQDYI